MQKQELLTKIYLYLPTVRILIRQHHQIDYNSISLFLEKYSSTWHVILLVHVMAGGSIFKSNGDEQLPIGMDGVNVFVKSPDIVPQIIGYKNL